MIVTKITRSGSDLTKTFHLVVDGEKQLSTPIYKVEKKEEFRNLGAKKIPMEQYAFRVHGRKDVVERFADAASVVLKKHKIEMDPEALSEAQIYVRKAFDIIAGKTPLSIVPPADVVDLKFQPNETEDTDPEADTRMSLEDALNAAYPPTPEGWESVDGGTQEDESN